MTQEQKFKKLLDIAIAKGCEIDEDLYNGLGEISGLTVYYDSDNPHTAYGMWSNKSLNDLVLNTNFFECLFKDFTANVNANITIGLYKNEIRTHLIEEYVNLISALKFKWVLEVEKGTSLEWLFKQFDL